MNHFIISAFLLSVVSILTAGLAIFHRPSSQIHRIFSAYWFSIGFWASLVAWQAILIPKISEFWWGWLLHLGCIFIPTLLLHFAFEFTRETRGRKLILSFAYGISGFYLLLNIFTTLFTHGIAYRDMYAYPRPSFFYPIYFITFVTSVIYGTYLFTRAKSRFGASHNKKDLRNFLIAQVLGYLGGMDNFAIMADIRIFPLYPYGLYLAVLYAGTALSGRIKSAVLKKQRSKVAVPLDHPSRPTSLTQSH